MDLKLLSSEPQNHPVSVFLKFPKLQAGTVSGDRFPVTKQVPIWRSVFLQQEYAPGEKFAS